jgi:hypothetical protein
MPWHGYLSSQILAPVMRTVEVTELSMDLSVSIQKLIVEWL